MTELKLDQINRMKENFSKDVRNTIGQNTVMKNGIANSAEVQRVIEDNNFIFSIDVDYEHVANQMQTGRCWMFACLNTLRHHLEKKYGLKDFQLSQNYTFFYDKLEKSNYFYENIIKTADRPISDRSVLYLLDTPQQDGGDWDLITAIIDKYGIVPKDKMNETHSSANSMELDAILNKKLRQDALTLRDLVNKGTSPEEIQAVRDGMLDDVYRMLSIVIGTPVDTFDFEYRDANKEYHIDQNLTPKEFYDKYIDIDLKDYIGVINVPTENMPFNKLYGVEMSGNMVGGRPNRYLNVDIDTLKDLTIKQLKGGDPVWFGCDVLQSSDIVKGIMAIGLYDYESLFNIDFTMDKGQRFEYRESLPTHAMVIGGVDIIDGKPTRWKVENSWGVKPGDKGYFVMNDAWMDQYTYEVAIHKDYFTPELLAVLDQEPTILPFWNAMNPVSAYTLVGEDTK